MAEPVVEASALRAGVNSNLRAARSVLGRVRHRLTGRSRNSQYVRLGEGTANTAAPLPAGAAQELVHDNPRLLELRRRYQAVEGPLSQHAFWTDEYRQIDLDLTYFRGDNAYVWQQRQMGDLRLKLFLYLQYLEQLDDRRLLRKLGEDDAFGCWTYDYVDHPRVSRDLLDSVNELYFLQRTWNLFDRSGFRVLDIGAGYGRLAHRMTAGVPALDHYYCVDAVPESTFLCEYYLRYRGVDPAKATVVPLDELERLPVGIDLAVNVHSFSEMSMAAIDEWLRLLVRLEVSSLLVVPNDPDDVLSMEADGTRLPAEGHIRDAGFDRVTREPIFLEPNLPELLGVGDKYFFYQRRVGP
jgi:putative sugar O-methyltransferase